MKMKRVLSLLLALVMTMSLLTLPSYAADDDTVTVTVNYVYDSNKAMVAQPYTAQLAKGAAFQKTISVPTLLNYSVPADKVEGLGSGITFADNTLSFDLASVTSDVTVTLYYVAGQAEYTVNHHYQNLNDDEYGEVETVTIEGDIDAYTNAAATSKPGFICTGVPQTIIAADGTTVVEIYYDREYYTVTFDVNGGINGPEPIYAKYGTTFKVNDIQQPEREGYVFEGWFDPDGKSIAGDVAIEGNVTYMAQWRPEKAQADYTIVLWGQNANDDEYSYLDSYEAWGNVGSQVTWKEDTLISHVHTDDCWDLTCVEEAHTHSADCLTCGHTHDLTCYGLRANAGQVTPSDEAVKYFTKLGLEEGKIYFFNDNGYNSNGDKYYLYLNGGYYEYSAKPTVNMGSQIGSRVECDEGLFHSTDYFYKYESKMSCGHHTDACYGCGKTEHKHDSNCGKLTCTIDTTQKKMKDIQPDSNLWKFKTSETVTVDANGSTVLNVYFDRTTFTLEFRKAYSNNNDNDYGAINARWGKNIKAEYEEIVKKAGSSFWSTSRNAGEPWTNYIGVMPKQSITYYRYVPDGYSNSTMTYYGEDLNGQYQKIFDISFKGSFIVSDEDRYEFEGFTYDHGTANNQNCDGAKFYYKRNPYKLEFYSASNNEADKTEHVKYQAPLSGYNYTPTQKPAGLEPDAIFVGWYLNPERTGEPYDLSAHTMPSHDIALYAKWVNGLFTVRTFTDDTMQTLYTYDGYSGKQENIVKYTKAPVTPTDPAKDGYVFAGWFYQDADGREQPFSFTMPITQNYDLYPKFTNQAVVSYTVHYYQEGTDTKLADDRTNAAMIGTTVTEKAKMGTELNLADAEHNYFPDKTSTSVVLNGPDMEITFYYKKDITVPYTVKYVDEHNMPLIADKVVTNNQFSVVTETYVSIAHYTPQQYQITKELSTDDPSENVIVFVYTAEKYTITYDANGGTLAGAYQVKYTVNDAITLAAAPTLEGYNFTGWKLDAAAGNWIAGDYTAQQSVDAGKYGNVTFVAQWQEKTANIKYEVVGPDGCGTVTPANETVKVVTDEATGSTATASSNNYKFVGWYDNKDCTGNPLSTDANYVPTKADGDLWVDGTTYYAKFEWNIADLTITKKAAQGTTIDEGQSFIFRVTGNGVDMYVTVQGADSVTIKDLLVGKYTVTEMTNWSWRYTPDEGGAKDVTVNGGVENTVTFTNTRTNPYWLSGDNYAINRADGRVVNK